MFKLSSFQLDSQHSKRMRAALESQPHSPVQARLLQATRRSPTFISSFIIFLFAQDHTTFSTFTSGPLWQTLLTASFCVHPANKTSPYISAGSLLANSTAQMPLHDSSFGELTLKSSHLWSTLSGLHPAQITAPQSQVCNIHIQWSCGAQPFVIFDDVSGLLTVRTFGARWAAPRVSSGY